MLPRIVGLSNALDMLFSSRLVDAQEALRIGLVSRIFPEERLIEGVLAYSKELASSVSPRSLGVIKKQIYEAQFQTLAEATTAADRELILKLTDRGLQGRGRAFRRKRPPAFTGQ